MLMILCAKPPVIKTVFRVLISKSWSVLSKFVSKLYCRPMESESLEVAFYQASK